jgi:RNA recognition motif-containing protein
MIVLDKHTQRPRGFGFLWFKDKLGMEDAIRDMHNKELEGRVISVTKAVPMDQTKPGTPAAALGGGSGARTREYSRGYPPRGGGGGGGYDRGGGGYDRGGG